MFEPIPHEMRYNLDNIFIFKVTTHKVMFKECTGVALLCGPIGHPGNISTKLDVIHYNEI